MEIDLSFIFKGSAGYTYKIDAWMIDEEGKEVGLTQYTCSEVYNYTKPEVQLPVPVLTVSEPGTVSAKLPDGEASGCELGVDYEFHYYLYKGNTHMKEGDQVGTETPCTFSVPDSDYSDYYVTAKAYSKDISKYTTSGESVRYSLKDGSVYGQEAEDPSDNSSTSQDSHSEDSSSNAAEVYKEWKPSTPEEAERYEAYSREAVAFTADAKNGYAVTVQNAMQGEKCYDSIKSVLGDFSIGRTYNIFPSGAQVYKADSKARITLNIPVAFQADKRAFKMICVTEKGLPVVLSDIDSDPKTITFETDTYYAFALIYK